MNFDVEKALIGCLMLDITSIEKVYLNLSEEKFTDPYLGRIYHEIRVAYDNGMGVDINTLLFQLGDLPEGVIQPLLVECVDSVSTSVKIEQYAKIIIKQYKARMLGKLINLSPAAEDIDKQIAELQEKLEVLTTDRVETAMTAKDLVNKYQSQRGVDNRAQGINVGIKKVDEMIGGLDGGDVLVIGARPSVGKTAFSVNVMMNIAKGGKRVEMFSLEMTNEQIYDRLISYESGVELMRERRALSFNDSEKPRIEQANNVMSALGDMMVFVDDAETVTEMSISIKKIRPDVIIIDYAQLIKPESKYKGNRYAEVGDISRSLKKMAKKFNIPVILLSQLNRTFDETKEPSMNELRESGDLEQDATAVILMWNKTEDRTQKGLKVDKSRNGTVGKTELFFDGARMRFSETGNFTYADDSEEDTPFT